MHRFPPTSLPQALHQAATVVFGILKLTSYLRIGSATAPTNTTAGDLTVGRINIGNLANGATTIYLAGPSQSSSASAYSIWNSLDVQSGVTTQFSSFVSAPTTVAASFTLASLRHYTIAPVAFGAGSSVTAQYGYHVPSTLTGAATNMAFYADIAAGGGRWNFYANGTARNYMAGALSVGATTDPGTGGIHAAGAIRSASATAGVGYVTGAGGTVTQGTDKSTTVVLDKVTGAITMHNATLNAGTTVGFTLTNSAIAATDLIAVAIKSGASADSYVVTVTAVAAGSCRIELRNTSAGNLGEAVVLSFAVIKAVTA